MYSMTSLFRCSRRASVLNGPPDQVQQEDKCTHLTPLFRCSRRTSLLNDPPALFRCSRRTSVLSDPTFQQQQEDKCTQWPLSFQVQQEDNMICDSVQVGLESSAYDVGRYDYYDYYRIA